MSCRRILRRLMILAGLSIVTFILFSVIFYESICVTQEGPSVYKWDKVPSDAPLLVLETPRDSRFPSAKIVGMGELARYGKEQGYFYVVPRDAQSAINKQLVTSGGSVRVMREGDGWQLLEVIISTGSFAKSCCYCANDGGVYPVFAEVKQDLPRRILAATVPAFVVNLAVWILLWIVIIAVRVVLSLFHWGKLRC